ncbi:MAG: flagellar basal body P-ring protein FlgI, partial [Thermoguttaceae bacterium]
MLSKKNAPALFAILFLISAVICGCTRLNSGISKPWNWGGSKEKEKEIKKIPTDRTSFVKEYATPYDTHLVVMNGFGLAYNLRGTGGVEKPGTERSLVLRDLQKKLVDRPNELIDSKNTAIVQMEAHMPAGAQVGDRVDVKVAVRLGSDATSLQGGYLPSTALREMQQV